MLLMSQSDKHGTEHREDISLNKGYQQLQAVHEEQHDDTERFQTDTIAYAHGPTQEYHAGEREDHGVTGHHVGKKTNHQGKGLGDDTKELDDGHDGRGIGLQEQRHLWPEDFLPVLFVGKDIDSQHRAECQEERDVDIASHVGTCREDGNQANQVGGQDKEEHGEQIGRIGLVVLLADGRLNQIVMDHHHHHLYGSHKSLGRFAMGIVALIPAGTRQEDGDEHDDYNPYLGNGLGDAQVYGAHLFASYTLIDLAMMLFTEEEGLWQSVGCAEMPLACILAPDDDGQGHTEMLAFVRGDMPLIGIGQVLQHNLRDVQFLAFCLFSMDVLDRDKQECHQQEYYRLEMFHYY